MINAYVTIPPEVDWLPNDHAPVGTMLSVLVPDLADIPEGVTVLGAWDSDTGEQLSLDAAGFVAAMPDDITWQDETPIRTRPTQPRQTHTWGSSPPLQF